MLKVRSSLIILAMCGALFFIISATQPSRAASNEPISAQGIPQIVQPAEDTTTILQNPLMGFQDHAVNSTWWPTSTGYLRAATTCTDGPCGSLMWDKLNPQQGVYDFSSIDRYIRDMKAQKKFVVFRARTVIGDTDTPTVPAWAKALGVTTSSGTEPFGGRTGVEIDYQKCIFQSTYADFVQQLVNHYDNEPSVVAVDVGGYGWYGEWFSGKTVPLRSLTSQVHDANDPTQPQSYDARTRVIRMYTGGSGTARCVDNNGTEKLVSYSYPGFKNKPVIASRGDAEDVQIGVSNGSGIRFDDVGVTSAALQFRTAAGNLVSQIWRTKPILGEFGSTSAAAADTTFMNHVICYAREFHVTGIHNNFGGKPVADFSPLWRELGYRITLQQATYPTSAAPGSLMQMNLSWLNKGTAPAYQRYPLKLYFKIAGTDTVVAQFNLPATNITQIMPEQVTATDSTFSTCPQGALLPYQSTEQITVPTLPSGYYDLSFAFIEPAYSSPIQLALLGKDSAGRYPLGRIAITTISGSGLPTATQLVQPTFIPPTATLKPANTLVPTTKPTFIPPTATLKPANTLVPTTVPTRIPPTATLKPTLIPTVKPSSTPVATSGLKVQYKTGSTVLSINQLVPVLNIVNAGSTSISLSQLKVRYYFTRDTASSMVFYCDWAQINCANVTGRFVQLTTPVAGADFYMEVGFSSTAGSLAPNGSTGEIWLRTNKSDWSMFNQGNDYSFDATKTALAYSTKVVLFQNGVAVAGILPH